MASQTYMIQLVTSRAHLFVVDIYVCARTCFPVAVLHFYQFSMPPLTMMLYGDKCPFRLSLKQASE